MCAAACWLGGHNCHAALPSGSRVRHPAACSLVRAGRGCMCRPSSAQGDVQWGRRLAARRRPVPCMPSTARRTFRAEPRMKRRCATASVFGSAAAAAATTVCERCTARTATAGRAVTSGTCGGGAGARRSGGGGRLLALVLAHDVCGGRSRGPGRRGARRHPPGPSPACIGRPLTARRACRLVRAALPLCSRCVSAACILAALFLHKRRLGSEGWASTDGRHAMQGGWMALGPHRRPRTGMLRPAVSMEPRCEPSPGPGTSTIPQLQLPAPSRLAQHPLTHTPPLAPARAPRPLAAPAATMQAVAQQQRGALGAQQQQQRRPALPAAAAAAVRPAPLAAPASSSSSLGSSSLARSSSAAAVRCARAVGWNGLLAGPSRRPCARSLPLPPPAAALTPCLALPHPRPPRRLPPVAARRERDPILAPVIQMGPGGQVRGG